jgi:hypothetical protein
MPVADRSSDVNVLFHTNISATKLIQTFPIYQSATMNNYSRLSQDSPDARGPEVVVVQPQVQQAAVGPDAVRQ